MPLYKWRVIYKLTVPLKEGPFEITLTIPLETGSHRIPLKTGPHTVPLKTGSHTIPLKTESHRIPLKNRIT